MKKEDLIEVLIYAFFLTVAVSVGFVIITGSCQDQETNIEVKVKLNI